MTRKESCHLHPSHLAWHHPHLARHAHASHHSHLPGHPTTHHSHLPWHHPHLAHLTHLPRHSHWSTHTWEWHVKDYIQILRGRKLIGVLYTVALGF